MFPLLLRINEKASIQTLGNDKLFPKLFTEFRRHNESALGIHTVIVLSHEHPDPHLLLSFIHKVINLSTTLFHCPPL